MKNGLTLGSLFTGIGGFDLGFENAGWTTRWQVEKNPCNQALLADRFPHARRFWDVRHVGPELECVDAICAGFPCQDISQMGSTRVNRQKRGLAGPRSGLFSEILRIVDLLQPPWLVLENVPALLSVNDSQDIQTVVSSLAQRGYLGSFRVLDSQYFGVPQKRRRLFVVAGLGRLPPLEFLADAQPVESIPCANFTAEIQNGAERWAGYTLTAKNWAGRLNIGSEALVAESGCRDQMVERARVTRVHGVLAGLDDPNHFQSYAAGNSLIPSIAEWIARILARG